MLEASKHAKICLWDWPSGHLGFWWISCPKSTLTFTFLSSADKLYSISSAVFTHFYHLSHWVLPIVFTIDLKPSDVSALATTDGKLFHDTLTVDGGTVLQDPEQRGWYCSTTRQGTSGDWTQVHGSSVQNKFTLYIVHMLGKHALPPLAVPPFFLPFLWGKKWEE